MDDKKELETFRLELAKARQRLANEQVSVHRLEGVIIYLESKLKEAEGKKEENDGTS